MSKPCDALKFSTRSEQAQYWALKPIKQMNPPNQIINQTYSPDVQAQFKLIVNNDERKNNVNYIPPKTRSHELENYAHHFNQFDYLGHYCARKINQIVYLRFNNAKYNQMADCKQKTKVMTGFYVPFQQLYGQREQCFTKHLGLKFPELHQQAILPTKHNNRGCSFDPMFCSQYEGSNLFAAIRKSPFDYQLFIQNDVNSCAQVCWFNFSIEFGQEGYYSFCIKNMTKNLQKLFERGMKISYCFLNNLKETIKNQTLNDWNFCGENISFSRNDIEIEGEPGQYYYDLYFQYRCKNKHQIVQFALERPYLTIDKEKYFNQIAPKKIRGITKIQKVQYGKTISGTPLHAYLIKKKRAAQITSSLSPPEVDNVSTRSRKSINLSPASSSLTPTSLAPPDAKHRTVIVIGRLGGCQVGSSSIIEGMIDFLLETLDYDFLKRTVNFYFVPMANPDAVKYGNSKVNLTGSNLQCNWKNPHRVYQAEVFHLKNFMSEINKTAPITHVFNLSVQNEEIHSSIVGTKNQDEDCEDSRIFPFVLAKRHHMISFGKSYFFQKNSNSSMTCVLTEMFPKILAFEMKVSRFQFVKEPEQGSIDIDLSTAELKQCTRQSYFNFGRGFMSDYLEHVKIYDRNSLLKDKWMRQIVDIEEKQTKSEPIVLNERPVEQKFSEKFYYLRQLISPLKPETKTGRKFEHFPKSRREKNSGEISSPYLSPAVRRHQNNLVRYCLKDLLNGRKNKGTASLGQSLEENIRKTHDKVENKGLPHFRIKQRTNQVLKNCTSSLINFEKGLSRLKRENYSPRNLDMQNLDLSPKKLNKLKNDKSFQIKQHKLNFASFLLP